VIQPIQVAPTPTDSSDTVKGTTPLTPVANYIYHKVSSGETMNSIATKYGVTIEKIMEWNALKTTNIYVGQRLQLLTGPGGTTQTQTQQQTPPPPVKKYYNVRSGDTFSKIAQRHGLSQAQLSKLNPGVNINKLTVGQRLRVK
jgi:membrane-bound lytic murein transglycosylase D